MDLQGPVVPCSLSGLEYSMLLLDEDTRYRWTYAIKRKNDVLKVFPLWLVLAERETGRLLISANSDLGGEFTGMKPFLDSKGIKLIQSPKDKHEMNPTAERAFGVHSDMIRFMFSLSGVPLTYWPLICASIRYAHSQSSDCEPQ